MHAEKNLLRHEGTCSAFARAVARDLWTNEQLMKYIIPDGIRTEAQAERELFSEDVDLEKIETLKRKFIY